MRISISISLLIILISLIPACITIETAPQPAPPPSFPIGPDQQAPSTQAEPVIEAFTINPSVINSGETAVLSWNVSGADSVSIAPDIGQVESAGAAQVSPAGSTLYTLTAANSSGTVNRAVQVDVRLAQPGSSPVQAAFAVIEVVAATGPSSDHCPEILYADITTNGAGTVNYQWESAEGGGYSYTFHEIFTSAGTKRVTLFQEMRALPSGMYQIHITSPNDIISNTTHYTTCAP